MGETCPPGEENDGDAEGGALGMPVAWTVDVGETSPPGEESDGDEGGDALGKMAVVEDGEGCLLALTEEVDGLESTETIEGEGLGVVEVGWLLIVTVALDNTV